MNKKLKKLLSTAVSAAMFVGILAPAIVVMATTVTTGRVIRTFGANRYETAAQVATSKWTTSDNVVLVSGGGYADAISATTLAKRLNAPILLTNQGEQTLNPDTETAIANLKAKNVYIIGGTGVIALAVETQLQSAGYSTPRFGGINRYATNVAVADELVELGVSSANVMMVGGSNYPDALSAAPIAANKDEILLLATTDVISSELAIDFAKLKNSKVTVIGTTNLVGATVATAVNAVERVNGGINRFDTNQIILAKYAPDLKTDKIYITSGNDYPDALVASPLAGNSATPLVLVDGTSDTATNIAVKYIATKATPETEINVIGGTGVVSDATVSAINAALIPIIVKPTGVSLNKTIDTLILDGTDSLSATILPSNATNQALTWTSSDNTIATVDNTGKITAISAGSATIIVTTVDGSETASCIVTVNNREGYVYNTDSQIDLNIRSAPDLNGTIIGCLYNYDTIEILDSIVDNSNNVWDKIIYNNSVAYVSDAYIQPYTSPPNNVVTIAANISKQFESATPDQIAGNADGQGLSLGSLQWCLGQGTLQPILNRMDREYNAEMESIFGTNYNSIHNMILDAPAKQLEWANSINDSSNNIIEPWHSQFVSLCNNPDFIKIETDAEVYTVKQAMLICDKYNLKTIRGFALAFDIAIQDGSIGSDASETIATALVQNPNMAEKSLLGVIANAVGSNPDILSRELAIVNGQGIVHGSMLYLDTNYGLNDNCWR